MIVALIVLLALQVGTQLTVDDDDSGSCESSTSNQVVNLIKEGFKNVETACASCASIQQQSVAAGSPAFSLCE